MTENAPIDPEQSITTDATPEQAATMPLTVGEFDSGFDPLGAGEGGRRISAGSILILVVIAIAVGGLVSMRTFTRVTSAVTVNLEVEKTIDDWLKSIKDDGDGVDVANPFAGTDAIEVLTAAYSEQQVPLTSVQKNPFVIPGEAAPENVETETERKLRERHARIVKLNEQLEQFATRFELKSVMMGSEPLGNIDGKIVQIGDILGEADTNEGLIPFTVTDLTAQSASIYAEFRELDVQFEHMIELEID